MPVLDAHVHLYPPEVNADPAGWAAAAGEAQWSRLCTRVRRDGRPVQGFPSADQLIGDLDSAGIDGALLLGWYWETGAACRRQNRFFASVAAAHPRRIQFFGTVHPGWSAEELDAELAQLEAEGCRGLGELSPHTQGGDEAAWGRIFRAAGERGWPVNLHVTDPASRPYPGRVGTPLEDFARWADLYPDTHYVLAHWAGGAEGLALLAGRPNVWFDTAASPLLYTREQEAALLAATPADRILWGTDHPLDLYPRETGGGPGRYRAEFAALAGATPAMQGDTLQCLLASRR